MRENEKAILPRDGEEEDLSIRRNYYGQKKTHTHSTNDVHRYCTFMAWPFTLYFLDKMVSQTNHLQS